MVVNHISKTTQIDRFPSENRMTRVHIFSVKELSRIMQGLYYGGFACRVGAKEKGDGFEFDPYRFFDTFKVLDGNCSNRHVYSLQAEIIGFEVFRNELVEHFCELG